MESTIRNIIIGGIVLVLLAGGGLFVIRRLGVGKPAGKTTDTLPLGETPLPTRIPLASTTPFPFLTLGTPSASALPSVTGSPKPTSSSAPSVAPTATPTIYSCAFLTLTPSEGIAPLAVKLTATGSAVSGANREYEFNFGDGSQAVKQKEASVNHTYQANGTFTASLKVRETSGGEVNIGDCKESIVVRSKTTTLPKTGLPLAAGIGLLPLAALGRYLFKKYKLV